MKWWGWLLLLLLLAAHQDYWLWSSRDLFAGFIPAGFAWHLGISLLAALFWWAIVTWSWPEGFDTTRNDDDAVFSDPGEGANDARSESSPL